VRTLLVVERPERWPLDLPGAEVVPARQYLTDRTFAETRRVSVFNVCRFYGYQRPGYYVSLLAAARGHRAMPSVDTLQAFGVGPLARITSEDLDEQIQRTLAPLRSPEFVLSIYFGRNVARRYDTLARELFDLFPAPLLRASFVHDEDHWRLQSIRPLAGSDVPDGHRPFVMEQASRFFDRPVRSRRPRPAAAYDLAILWDPDAADSASDETAIRRFIRAAQKVGLEPSVISSEDYSRIAEFDALFIRETTSVNHHTYRFAQRALAEDLVVIDDPRSIIRCGNKVYQAELFARHDVPHPRTLIVHPENVEEVAGSVGFPCVLKRPDSSFSTGVVKVADRAALDPQLEGLFKVSQLVVAQEFVPSSFDWRIGVLAGRPLYACKYHMASGHWQIIQHREGHKARYGRVETMAIEDAPAEARELAVKVANLIGDGLYGVDIKEVDGRFLVIEVNDNPSIDAGWEDEILKDALYVTIMQHMRDRLDDRITRDNGRG
jgi:glutathione synthase/RimK-type ligase-like ATP-grasp enzyme